MNFDEMIKSMVWLLVGITVFSVFVGAISMWALL